MNLSSLYLANSFNDCYRSHFKKQADPNSPEMTGTGTVPQPQRSGNQDTPMKPRHRRFFNAPAPGTEKKLGYPDREWTNRYRGRPRPPQSTPGTIVNDITFA